MGRDAPFTITKNNNHNNNKMPLYMCISIAVERHGNISSHLPVEMYGNNNITNYSSTTCITSQTSTVHAQLTTASDSCPPAVDTCQ